MPDMVLHPGGGGGVATSKGAYQMYVDLMFNLAGAAVTSLTAMNPGTSNIGTSTQSGSAYSPKADGFLRGLHIQISGQAASSLAQSGYIQLTCTQWSPVNTLNIPFTGFGLLTAPQLLGGNLEIESWPELYLPVKTSVPISGSVVFHWSPVTPVITVTGVFAAESSTAAK